MLLKFLYSGKLFGNEMSHCIHHGPGILGPVFRQDAYKKAIFGRLRAKNPFQIHFQFSQFFIHSRFHIKS